jgi:hypothetical protein
MMEVKDNMGEKFHANRPAGSQARQGEKMQSFSLRLNNLVSP